MMYGWMGPYGWIIMIIGLILTVVILGGLVWLFAWAARRLELISRCWEEIKNNFSHSVYSEKASLPSGKKATIFCTFHGSARSLTHAARCYTNDVDNLLSEKLKQLPDPSATKQFLRENPKEVPTGKGMRVLLLHWLEIGMGIRQAAQE